MGTDDAANSKPNGRFLADTPTLKTRNEFLRVGTWNVRTLYQAGKLDNLRQEFAKLTGYTWYRRDTLDGK